MKNLNQNNMKKTPGPKKKELKEDLKSDILNSAKKLFLDKGYSQTSTIEIAKNAGCNQALVHYYFKSKENLFMELFKKKFEEVLNALFSVPQQNASIEEIIKDKVDAHFNLIKEDHKLPFLVMNEILLNPVRLEQIKTHLFSKVSISEVFKSIQEMLDKEHDKGTIRKLDALDFILNIISLNVFTFISFPILYSMVPHKISLEEEFINNRKKEIITLIINGIKL